MGELLLPLEILPSRHIHLPISILKVASLFSKPMAYEIQNNLFTIIIKSNLHNYKHKI